MPSVKMKTHKGTKRRFKVSATGKVMHKRCGSSHLNSGKGGKKIRKLRKKGIIHVLAEGPRLRRALGIRHYSTRNGLPANTPSHALADGAETETAPAES